MIGGYTAGHPSDVLIVGYYEGANLMYAAKVRNSFVPNVAARGFRKAQRVRDKDSSCCLALRNNYIREMQGATQDQKDRLQEEFSREIVKEVRIKGSEITLSYKLPMAKKLSAEAMRKSSLHCCKWWRRGESTYHYK